MNGFDDDQACPWSDSVGAYVLGGLDPEEARHLEAHLETCAACRTEVNDLSSIPAFLDMVPLERVREMQTRARNRTRP